MLEAAKSITTYTPEGYRESKEIKRVVPPNEDIHFRNVSFSYNSRAVVLSDFNLTIKRGQFIALVGASGSGEFFIRVLLANTDKP